MFTSDTNVHKKFHRAAINYLLISIFCALFGGVYEVFSHGVLSFHMIYAFAFPLVLGALPFTVWSKKNVGPHHPSLIVRSCYHPAIATATVGCILQGVIEIFGTSNDLMSIYIIASSVLFLASLVLYIIQLFLFSRN